MKKTGIGYFICLGLLSLMVLLSLLRVYSSKNLLTGLLVILVVLQLITSGVQLAPMSDLERITKRLKEPSSKAPLLSLKQVLLILFPLVIAVCILQLS